MLRYFLTLFFATAFSSSVLAADDETVRVFIFAGQSNMVGSDSKVADIGNFPPFAGLEKSQDGVKFSYCLGREEKMRSDGWVALEAVDKVVGPELSFARKVTQHLDAPIAIIKCAAGGTHLGGDWNPDTPEGFKMYPLLLDLVRSSLAEFEKAGIPYRIEGFMWHQGENDMFNEDYQANYGANLANFLTRVRADLKTPELKFYIGELCTKTIWGMDLRPRMDAISRGQKAVTTADPLAEYIPTSHVGVEIGGGAGLHYHYGTLGQLEHGENYADAYLRTIGKLPEVARPLPAWPYEKGSAVKLFVLAGHRNMEGERAFVQELANLEPKLLVDDATIAFKYNLGGGARTSKGWEPLGPAGYYDTFGPEVSFGESLRKAGAGNIAIAKFTHSGSQIIDWTPEGSMATARNLFPSFIGFIKESIADLEAKGQSVELAGIVYHLGENDMSFSPFRKDAARNLQALIAGSRSKLGLPELDWFVSQQAPTDDESVNAIDVTAMVEEAAAADGHFHHLKAFVLPPQAKKLVLDTAGVIQLGKLMAEDVLKITAESAPAEDLSKRAQVLPGGKAFFLTGRAAFLMEPRAAAQNESGKPWIFYGPTLNAYPDQAESWMHQQFLDAGIAIAGIDVGEAYGSPKAFPHFEALFQEMVARGYSRKPALLGRSRGGLWVSSWALHHPERVAGIGGIYPVYDFTTYPGTEKAAPAYGISEEELIAQQDTLNPIKRAPELAKAKIPILIIHGTTDTVVPIEQNSAALETAYREQGAGDLIKILRMEGQGHSFWPGFFHCQELVDFLIAKAKGNE